MHITFEIPGGLLIRQAHHWAGLLLPASIIMQILATFFTGALPATAPGAVGAAVPDLHRRPRGRLERLRPARRHALGHRAAHHRGHRARHPARGHLAQVAAVRRAVPGRDHRAPVSAARVHRARTAHRARRGARVRGAGSTSRRSSRGAGAASGTSWACRCCRPRRPAPVDSSRSSPGAAAHLGGGHDQPDLALRPGLARATRGRQPARLVHGLPRRRPAPRASRLGVRVARPHLDARDPRAPRGRDRLPDRDRRLPVRRGVDHGRPPRAPPARPPAQRAHPHRDRRRRHRLLRHPLDRGQRRPHLDALLGDLRVGDHACCR